MLDDYIEQHHKKQEMKELIMYIIDQKNEKE